MLDRLTDPLTGLIAVVLLVAANAFFVGAEFALVKARRVRESGPTAGAGRVARRIQANLANLEAHLVACQLGVAMASIGLGWVFGHVVSVWLEIRLPTSEASRSTWHASAFAIGFLALCSLHFVFGVQVPKVLAIGRPASVSRAVAYPLRVFYVLCSPLLWLLNRVAGAVVARLHPVALSYLEALTGEDRARVVGTPRGELGRAAMLHHLVQFDDRPVGRIMTPRSECEHLDARADPAAHARAIRAAAHARLPLVDGDPARLVGVVSAREVLTAMLDGAGSPLDIRRFAHTPLTVPESRPVSGLFEQMHARGAPMTCIVDAAGTFVGLVTFADVVEAVVGDVADEGWRPGEPANTRTLEAPARSTTRDGAVDASADDGRPGMDPADDKHRAP